MPIDNQGPTYRCGPYAAREWFEAYGHDVTGTSEWATAIARADAQHGSSFADEDNYIYLMATELHLAINWLGSDGYLTDFPTFDQAVRDGWCVVVGVAEADLHPGQNYYHFLAVDGIDGDTFSIKDSFSVFDGETGHPSVEALHQAIKDNWDASVVGLAWRFA